MITDPVHERLHYSAQEVCLALGVNDFNRLDEKTQRALQDLAMYCGCSHVPWFSTPLSDQENIAKVINDRLKREDIVHVPAGTFTTSETIVVPPGRRVVGAGPNETTIIPLHDDAAFFVEQPAIDNPVSGFCIDIDKKDHLRAKYVERGEFPEGVSMGAGVSKKCSTCGDVYTMESSSTKGPHVTAAGPPKSTTILEEVKHVLECHDLYLVNSTASIPFNDPDTLLVEHAIIARPSRESPVEKAIRQEKQLEEMMKRVRYVGQEGVATKEYADQAARPLNLKIDDLEVEIAPEEVANLNNDLHDQMLETMKKSGSAMVTPCPVYVRGQGEEQEEE